jgi:bifunctional non-homologous end joining protein LigD
MKHELYDLAAAGTLTQQVETLKGGCDALPHGEYLMEPKYDGWRIIAYVGEDRVDLFARSGNLYNGKLPKIEAELLAKFPPGTVLDGEAVSLVPLDDGRVMNEWGVAQSVLSALGGHAASDRITFMVWDLLAHAGIDARALPLSRRRLLLERLFEAGEFDAIALSIVTEPTDENYERFVKMGFEGAVIKSRTRPYASGRREGRGWYKLKPITRIDAVIMGFKPGKSGFTGLVGSVIFGQHDPASGELVERGFCSGFDMRTRLDMTHHPEKWIGKVIEVSHLGVDIGNSKSGRFRSAQMKRVRNDRKADQVVIHDA